MAQPNHENYLYGMVISLIFVDVESWILRIIVVCFTTLLAGFFQKVGQEFYPVIKDKLKSLFKCKD